MNAENVAIESVESPRWLCVYGCHLCWTGFQL